jgi:hypothetical protein
MSASIESVILLFRQSEYGDSSVTSRFQPATYTGKKARLGESLPRGREFCRGLLAAMLEPEDQQARGRRSLAPDAGECKISVP